MNITQQIDILTAAHDADERARTLNQATEFVLSPAGRIPFETEALTRWLKCARDHLSLLTREQHIQDVAPALIARLRADIGVAEARHEVKAAAKVVAAEPALAQTNLVPAPAVAVPKPSRSAAVIPVPVTNAPTPPAKPAEEPQQKSLHRTKKAIIDRRAQAEVKALADEIAGIHSALKRYRAQLAEETAHTRHRFELERRVEALEIRLIQAIQAKNTAQQNALKNKT